MKLNKTEAVFIIILSLCLLALLRLCTGCSSSKNVHGTRTELNSEQSDSIRTYKAERDRFEELYNELIYSEVLFDTLKLHDTTILTNTVTITKEGEVRAVGNIRSARVSQNLLIRTLQENEKTIDSLRSAKSKTEYITKTVEKTKKVRFFPGWIWFLMLAALLGGNLLSKYVSLPNIFKRLKIF